MSESLDASLLLRWTHICKTIILYHLSNPPDIAIHEPCMVSHTWLGVTPGMSHTWVMQGANMMRHAWVMHAWAMWSCLPIVCMHRNKTQWTFQRMLDPTLIVCWSYMICQIHILPIHCGQFMRPVFWWTAAPASTPFFQSFPAAAQSNASWLYLYKKS